MLSHKMKNKSKPIEFVSSMHPFLALQILPEIGISQHSNSFAKMFEFEKELVLNVEKNRYTTPKYKYITCQ